MSERKSECASEVARLRQQIAAELEALERGFSAYAAGVARHEFIRIRMEKVGHRQEELALYVGKNNAEHMVCELYMDKVAHHIEPANQ